MTENPSPSRPQRAETIGWCALFGTVYFVQGISELTAGLMAQPMQNMMKGWNLSPGSIAEFFGLLGFPWSIKPLYGLLTDFIPLFGLRRKSYLVLTSLAATLGLGYFSLIPPQPGQAGLLLFVLMLPSIGLAFSDVVIDALMVDKGQPRGLTGMFQSVQWSSIYGAQILTGLLGGVLSKYGLVQLGFAICATATLVTFVLAVVVVRESPLEKTVQGALGWGAFGRALAGLWRAARSPAVLTAGSFIFVWNFNPFSASVLQSYFTGPMRFDEVFYGETQTWMAVGAVISALLFGLVCRRVPFPKLLHLSIVMGMISTLLYIAVWNEWSARVVSLAVGLTYMLGLLVQLDLAARVCPPEAAGTTFALLMAISNFSTSLATIYGGQIYDQFGSTLEEPTGYRMLVLSGTAFTSLCWILVPMLRRLQAQWEASAAAPVDPEDASAA